MSSQPYVVLSAQGELPVVWDHDDLESCARKFASDNGIPYERFNVSVFQDLVSLDTIEDVLRSSLFCKTTKQAALKCQRRANESDMVRTFLTQGILRPFVFPTEDEGESAYGRLDVRDSATGFQRMRDLPFFSECVSVKFLQFWVAPNGKVRFCSELAENMSEECKRQFTMAKRLIEQHAARKEALERERRTVKLEKKDRRRRALAEKYATAGTVVVDVPAPPLAHAETSLPTTSSEEEDKLRRRKERAAKERARRRTSGVETTTTHDRSDVLRRSTHTRMGITTPRRLSAPELGRKAERIEQAAQHAARLRQRESDRVAQLEALKDIGTIGTLIQRGD